MNCPRNGQIGIRESVRRSADQLSQRRHMRGPSVPDSPSVELSGRGSFARLMLRVLSCIIVLSALAAVLYFVKIVLRGPIKPFPDSLR